MNLTKTRHEYSQKVSTAAHGYGMTEEDNCSSDSESEQGYESDDTFQETAATESRLQFSYRAHKDIEEILECYTSAVSLQAAPLFAMSTGHFDSTLAGNKVTFMVNTGSELNLMSEEFYRRTSLPLDHDGTHWSLKGINGPAVPLVGCV